MALDNKDLLAPVHATVPKSYKEASKPSDFDTHWKPACREQFNKLTAAGTWTLIDRRPDMMVLPGKWVSNRARWVVCGNFENGDYSPHEVYSAAVHASSVRIFFNLVAVHDLESSFDMVGAYHNALIPDGVEAYVQQPTGFSDGTNRVCCLDKALNGLQRSALWWYQTLTPELKKPGFEPLTTDGCIFKKEARGALLLLYVDDLRVAAATTADIDHTVNSLAGIFELKKLGEAGSFLGYSIVRDRNNRIIYLHQANYVNKILDRFGKQGLNPVRTPWIPGKFALPKSWEPVKDAVKLYQTETGFINFFSQRHSSGHLLHYHTPERGQCWPIFSFFTISGDIFPALGPWDSAAAGNSTQKTYLGGRTAMPVLAPTSSLTRQLVVKLS